MPNGDDEDLMFRAIERAKKAETELQECKAGNAKLIHALDCAIIWAEALFAWLPEGTVMPEGILAAKNNLSRALEEVRK